MRVVVILFLFIAQVEAYAQVSPIKSKKVKSSKVTKESNTKLAKKLPKKVRKKKQQNNDQGEFEDFDQNLELSTLPNRANITTTPLKQAKVDETDTELKVESKFTVTAGNDSNPLIIRDGNQSTFYEMSPELKISGDALSAKFSAKLHDFSDQQTSNQGKATGAAINLELNTKFIGETKSTTGLNLTYSDERWPDFLNESNFGMPLRYLETKASQRLAWDMGDFNLALDGSYALRDYSSTYSDFAETIFQRQFFQNDFREVAGSVRVGVKFTKNIEFAATPIIKHRVYQNRPARQTTGVNGGALLNDGNAEWVDSEILAELKMNLGPLEVTPSVTSGVRADQIHAAEDYTMTGAGLSANVVLEPKSKFTLSGSINYKNFRYDNWRVGVINSGLREDDETSSSLKASMNIKKNISIALSLDTVREISNIVNDPSETYLQRIVGTSLSVQY
jgi:hypothetical protein